MIKLENCSQEHLLLFVAKMIIHLHSHYIPRLYLHYPLHLHSHHFLRWWGILRASLSPHWRDQVQVRLKEGISIIQVVDRALVANRITTRGELERNFRNDLRLVK